MSPIAIASPRPPATPPVDVVVERALRFGLAACFLGHGLVALGVNPAWFAFYATFGLDEAFAIASMPFVGALDVAVAALLVLRASPVVVAWCVVWTVFTASLRPLSGMPVAEFVVRAMNFGPAIALLLVQRRTSPRALRAVVVGAACAVVVGGLLGGAWAPARSDDVLGWFERGGAVALIVASAVLLKRGVDVAAAPRAPAASA